MDVRDKTGEGHWAEFVVEMPSFAMIVAYQQHM